MNTVERYHDLVLATMSHARHLGVQARMEAAPASANEPFVFGYNDSLERGMNGVIFVFPPADICFNSIVLSKLTQLLRLAMAEERPATLLFSEENLRSVRNVLQAAGIPTHATVQSYAVNSLQNAPPGTPRYRMEWLLPRGSLPADDRLEGRSHSCCNA